MSSNQPQASLDPKSEQNLSTLVSMAINYPSPPLCIVPAELSVQQGEKVILELSNGHKLTGKLHSFDSEKGNISVTIDDDDKPKTHGMHEIVRRIIV